MQSGIGVVHNSFLFDKPQRTVVQAPFKPFPRNLLSLSFTLLPRPPWFITHRKGAILGRLLVAFQHRPSLLKIPRIFLNALARLECRGQVPGPPCAIVAHARRRCQSAATGV